VTPVVLALRLPRFMLKYQFGVTNRPSRSYEALVARYLKALDGMTAVAPKQFHPPPVQLKKGKSNLRLMRKLFKNSSSLHKNVQKKIWTNMSYLTLL